MSVYINAIGTAVPRHRIEQSAIVQFMAQAHQMSPVEQRRLIALYRASGIHYRHSVLPDFKDPSDHAFFPIDKVNAAFPTVKQRMSVFQQEAPELSLAAVRSCFANQIRVKPHEVTHLITVSCTGMHAPGIDIELVNALGLSAQVQRTCISFMGCYAAFNALKVASHIIQAQPDAKVLIVCVEICTIHFRKEKIEDNLLSNALFADGAAAVLLSNNPQSDKIQLQIEHFHCDLAPEGSQEMAWQIGDFGFEMKLSAYVPDIISQGICQLAAELLDKVQDQKKIDYFAIHPGGKRILTVIEEQLGLNKEDNRYAYEILQNYGNMSSATVLFVLLALWQDLTHTDVGKRILSFAFGPGLTMESMLLKVE